MKKIIATALLAGVFAIPTYHYTPGTICKIMDCSTIPDQRHHKFPTYPTKISKVFR